MGVVYRPNEAKVRNLKTKDYLGKARLVAASDRANAFTGFAGSEIKNVSFLGLSRFMHVAATALCGELVATLLLTRGEPGWQGGGEG